MSRRTTPTKVRLTVAMGLMYKEISEMPLVTPEERGARDELQGILRMMLRSDGFVTRLAAKMDEVE